jgi:hypothetical protein
MWMAASAEVEREPQPAYGCVDGSKSCRRSPVFRMHERENFNL